MSYSSASSELEKKNDQMKDGFQPYRMSIEEVTAYFDTDIENGLTSSQAKTVYDIKGGNNLGDDDKISYSKIFAHQMFNAMILVLIISMVIALAIRDWITGGVIGFVVFINILVGFVQELKAEKTMGSLRSLSSPTAFVLRNGDDVTIPADEVVPGDIVHIKVGDTVPADLRLIDTMNLESDEAFVNRGIVAYCKGPQRDLSRSLSSYSSWRPS